VAVYTEFESTNSRRILQFVFVHVDASPKACCLACSQIKKYICACLFVSVSSGLPTSADVRCASFDGDGDRIVYYFTDSRKFIDYFLVIVSWPSMFCSGAGSSESDDSQLTSATSRASTDMRKASGKLYGTL
jgi:hypothetical protein